MARADDEPRDDISIHDTMRVVDGVVRPRGTASPNGASQVPAPSGYTDPQHAPDDQPEARAPGGG